MKRPKKHSFSKCGILFVFLLYAELIVFGQVAMWYFGDLSSLDSMWLYALPPILALLGYFLKATKENTCGGIIYDCAMKQQNAEHHDDAPEESEGPDECANSPEPLADHTATLPD